MDLEKKKSATRAEPHFDGIKLFKKYYEGLLFSAGEASRLLHE